ncbi:hypothetical protein [Streptomyces malaysiense]|uniref:Uncharacterized protein n=1 Tax=Streptomyces malaysiense TaxID=1428626 RepID=A0A1J4PU43_9ACTN|nr:hypothetical protein [Streptomyces malaysiense]OIK23487.1 hypothetical protein VT52_032350 [Streptomyces malaysiense]
MIAGGLFPERSRASYDDEEPRTWYQVRGSSVLASVRRTSAASRLARLDKPLGVGVGFGTTAILAALTPAALP